MQDITVVIRSSREYLNDNKKSNKKNKQNITKRTVDFALKKDFRIKNKMININVIFVTNNKTIYTESQIYEYIASVFTMSYYIFKIKYRRKMSLM